MTLGIEVELAGVRMRNPLVLASGIMGNTASALIRVYQAGAGALTTKTVTKHPVEGYPNPVVVELPFGLINAMGLPNPGVDYFLEELREVKRRLPEAPLIVSVGGNSPEEVADVASVVDVGDAIEINASCPHVSGHGLEIGSTPEMIGKLVGKVRESTSKPLFVKLTPMTHDIRSLGKAAVEAGADVLVAINTLRAMVIDVEAMKPVLSNKFGGLSGPAIRPVAVRAVYELSDLAPVVGVGGVETWRDALEMLMAGASAVGIGTAIYRRGLNVFREVSEGIINYLRSRGLTIEEVVGAAKD